MLLKEEIKIVTEDFTLSELLKLATELEVTCSKTITSSKLVVMLYNDIEENGVPEETSDLLEDFLMCLGYIDDDEDSDEQEPKEEELVKPTCFGFHDGHDPICKDCPVATHCKKVRISNRPNCFGLLFDRTNEDCKGCIEFGACGNLFKSREK